MHNLLSINQLCDKGYEVIFDKSKCLIKESKNNQVIFEGQRNGNVYTINIAKYINHEKCLASIQEDSWLWHRRLGHINMDKINFINKNDLVRGLPMIKYEKNKECEACQLGKQNKSSFKNKQHISTSRPLELLHMDLFGPSRIASLGGKSYVYVIIDDYSRFTWVIFLAKKNEACIEFSKLCKKIQNSKGYLITSIRSDHRREFENQEFE